MGYRKPPTTKSEGGPLAVPIPDVFTVAAQCVDPNDPIGGQLKMGQVIGVASKTAWISSKAFDGQSTLAKKVVVANCKQ